MLELYGRQWEASYGHVDGDAYPAWRDALAELTPARVKIGLDAVIAEGNEYPPNLIKFIRLCRTTTPPAYRTYKPALPKAKPHYSVMRVERAKQRALMDEEFTLQLPSDCYQMDWTSDDEEALCGLIEQWDPATGKEGLDRLIDHHWFSQGSHYSKTVGASGQ